VQMTSRQEELIERGVRALERMAEDPVIQVETGPPVCPHCEKINPTVRVEETTATGALGEFIIQAHCTHCNHVFYAVPYQWAVSKTVSEAGQILKEKTEMTNVNEG